MCEHCNQPGESLYDIQKGVVNLAFDIHSTQGNNGWCLLASLAHLGQGLWQYLMARHIGKVVHDFVSVPWLVWTGHSCRRI